MNADDTRQHLALALDVDDLVVALRLARRLRPWFGVAKVGLELFSAAGPETISAMTVEGYRVFLDLKLHDIPTTVRRAATVMGGLGVAFATVHTLGGADMIRAAVDGMTAGAAAAGGPSPCVLGVTVLTSQFDAPAAELISRATLASKAGCGGIVCAATDLEIVDAAVPDLLKVVPGIRPAGASADDQARAATPAEAMAAGADLLVIGRAVTAADDPEVAAAKVFDEIAQTTPAQRG